MESRKEAQEEVEVETEEAAVLEEVHAVEASKNKRELSPVTMIIPKTTTMALRNETRSLGTKKGGSFLSLGTTKNKKTLGLVSKQEALIEVPVAEGASEQDHKIKEASQLLLILKTGISKSSSKTRQKVL